MRLGRRGPSPATACGAHFHCARVRGARHEPPGPTRQAWRAGPGYRQNWERGRGSGLSPGGTTFLVFGGDEAGDLSPANPRDVVSAFHRLPLGIFQAEGVVDQLDQVAVRIVNVGVVL